MPEAKALLWCDLETTGSDENKDQILEVGAVITDLNFNALDVFESTVALTDEGSDRLFSNSSVLQMHKDNGLLDEIEDSGKDVASVDSALCALIARVAFVREFKPHELLLAGSGVSHFDRRFIKVYLPETEAWLQYPNMDIGVIRRFFLYFGLEQLVPSVAESFGADKQHRALADVWAHIREAKHYKDIFDKLADILE